MALAAGCAGELLQRRVDGGPKPFHNAGKELVKSGDGWIWQGEGDNYGETNQLEDCWYTYEASL